MLRIAIASDLSPHRVEVASPLTAGERDNPNETPREPLILPCTPKRCCMDSWI